MKPERTKEEILNDAAEQYARLAYEVPLTGNLKVYAMADFKAGARWMESQSSPVESKWVSVKERPKNGELVLLANVTDGWVVAGCRLGKHYWNQFQQGTDEPTIYPTHWQPLPELPPIEETK